VHPIIDFFHPFIKFNQQNCLSLSFRRKAFEMLLGQAVPQSHVNGNKKYETGSDQITSEGRLSLSVQLRQNSF